jgi:hypothetical protein
MKALNLSARIITAIALAANAYLHFRLADTYDAVTGTLLSLGDLFRVQGVAGVLVAVTLVVLSRRWVSLMAAVLAGAGIVVLVASVFVPLDLSAVGLPVIFEPSWYQDKLLAVAAQGIAMVAAVLAALSAGPSRAPVTKS